MAIEVINSTTYSANDLGEVKPKIKIGGNESTKFIPNINMSFGFGGDEEFFININRSEKIITNEIAELNNDTISQTVGIETDEFYVKNGRLKFDTVFVSKPPVLKLVYDVIQSNNIEWLYQPELTPEEIARGVGRPDEIIGSYAVYCNKSNNQYKTGKLFHILRPFVLDMDGNTAWCDMVYKDGKLTITLPKAFMDSAVYPVRLDPTFGYESIGGSTDYWTNAKAAYANSTPGSDGTLDSITIYCYRSSGSGTLLSALYSNNAGSPDSRLATSSAGDTVTTTPAWYSTTISTAITNGTQYWFGFQESNLLYYYYDSGTAELAVATSTATLDDPFGGSLKYDQRASVYGSYTAAGGTPIPVFMHHSIQQGN